MNQSHKKFEDNDMSENSLLRVEEMRNKVYQSMSAGQKLAVAADLYYSAFALKKARLKRLHPEWSEQEVEQKTREWILYAKT